MTILKKIAGEKTADKHVIFIHGLGGDWKETWKTDQGTPWLYWLAGPGICVWSVSYEAQPTRWTGQSMGLIDRGKNIASLLLAQSELRGKILSFVAHSLGGLVVKQVFRSLDLPGRSADAKLLLSRVDKVCFIAVPHFGSDLTHWVKGRRWLIKPNVVVSDLTRDNPSLTDLNLWYRGWSKKVQHLVLYETKPLSFLFWRFSFLVVSPSSSDPGLENNFPIPVDADHCSIVRPVDKQSFVYKNLRDFIDSSVLNGSVADVQREVDSLINNPNETVNVFVPLTFNLGEGLQDEESRNYKQHAANFLEHIDLPLEAEIVQERHAIGIASIATAAAKIGFDRNDLGLVRKAMQRLEEGIATFPRDSAERRLFLQMQEENVKRLSSLPP